jgi:hypothetical protein
MKIKIKMGKVIFRYPMRYLSSWRTKKLKTSVIVINFSI